MRTSRIAEKLVARIEGAKGLDTPSDALADQLHKVIRPGVIEDVLSGTPAGHAVHPALVAVPIGAWTTSLVLDLAGESDAAGTATAFGTLAALPAALTGANDWLTTSGPERRVGLIHAIANYAGMALQACSWFARRRGNRSAAIALSASGLSVVGVAGWLGGHLAFAMGVGVDTTAFQKLPSDWVDIAAEHDVPNIGAIGVEADGVPVLLTRLAGSVVAIADRCTHRGAPLHEGEIADGCVTCPWHGGVFSLADGSVQSGPPTRPQPAFEVEISNGRVRVRRDEQRSLRMNPVGR